MLLLSLSQPLSRDVADRRLSAAVAPVPRARRRRRPPDRRLLRVRAGRAAAQVPPLPGMNCIKIGLPEKSILGDHFQENMTSQRPFLLLRIIFPGRPIFIQFIPGTKSCPLFRTCGGRSRTWGSRCLRRRLLESVQQFHFGSQFAYRHFNLQIGTYMRRTVIPYLKLILNT